MNKYQEAINNIEYLIYKLAQWNQIDETQLRKDYNINKDFEALYELIDLTIPKPLIFDINATETTNAIASWFVYGYCPKCGLVQRLKHRNCPECGQVFYWEDDIENEDIK